MLNINNTSFKNFHHKDLNCDIRAVYINDKPWFVGIEVANLLSDSINLIVQRIQLKYIMKLKDYIKSYN